MPGKQQLKFAKEIDDGIPRTLSRSGQIAFVKEKLETVFKRATLNVVKLCDITTPEQFRDSLIRAKEAVQNALKHEKSTRDPDLFRNELSETSVNELVKEFEKKKRDKLAKLAQDALQNRVDELVNMDDRSPNRCAPKIVDLIKAALEANYNFFKQFALKTDVQINELRHQDVQSISQFIEDLIKSYVEYIKTQTSDSIAPEEMLALCNGVKKEIVILFDILSGFNPASYDDDNIAQRKNSTQKEINAELKSYLYSSKKSQLSVHDTPTSHIVFFNIEHRLEHERSYTLLVYAIVNGKVALPFNEKRFVSDKVAPSLLAAIESMLINNAFASAEEAEKFFIDIKTAAYSIKDEAAKIPHMQFMVTQLLMREFNRLTQCGGFASVRVEAARKYLEAEKIKKIKSLEKIKDQLDEIVKINNDSAIVLRSDFFSIGSVNVAEMRNYVQGMLDYLNDPSKSMSLQPPKPVGGALEKIWNEIELVRANLVSPAHTVCCS